VSTFRWITNFKNFKPSRCHKLSSETFGWSLASYYL